jgi:hypothetical protein
VEEFHRLRIGCRCRPFHGLYRQRLIPQGSRPGLYAGTCFAGSKEKQLPPVQDNNFPQIKFREPKVLNASSSGEKVGDLREHVLVH